MDTYPVAFSRSLGPAIRQGALQGWRKTRTAGEIPRLEPHQALVLHVGDALIVDNVQYPLDSQYIVDATHVSLVDLRQHAPVEVTLHLASADAAVFDVVVTFGCTVLDPETIVRNKTVDVSSSLAQYLKGYPEILNVGTGFPLPEYAEARRRAAARITATFDLDPPFIPGLAVALISVELPPPPDVTVFEGTKLGVDRDIQIKTQTQSGQHLLSANDHAHEIRLGNSTNANGRSEAAAEAANQILVEDLRFQSKVKQFGQMLELVGSDPYRVQIWAMTIGEGEAREVAAALEQAAMERVRADAALAHDQLQVYSHFLHTLVERGHFDDTEVTHLLKEFAARLKLPNFAEVQALDSAPDSGDDQTSVNDRSGTPTSGAASEEDDIDDRDANTSHVN